MQSIKEVQQALRLHLLKGYSLETFEAETTEDIIQKAKTMLFSRLDKPFEKRILSSCGRLLNRFCIGSDPEFVFISPGNRKVAAWDLSLRPGLAAGCDQNSRLAELKGWPSRSVMKHTASLLVALRWLYARYTSTQDVRWGCPPTFNDDGIGGHVHFGRKRPQRDLEIAGLDGLATLFYHMRLFDNRLWDQRRAGDSRGQRYGLLGDIRIQRHGYEYRTLPSWLASPSKAFVCLAASKLVVLWPELAVGWANETFNFDQGLRRLKILADLFAGRDDDAWVLRAVLDRQEWRPSVADNFRVAWGLTGVTDEIYQKYLIPPLIEPTKEDVAELQAHLLTGTPLTFPKVLTHSFPGLVPKHYVSWLYSGFIDGLRRAGVGDLVADLVIPDPKVTISSVELFVPNGDVRPEISSQFGERAVAVFREFFKTVNCRVREEKAYRLIIPSRYFGPKYISELKNMLLSGPFPIWKIGEVKPNTFLEWAKTVVDKKSASKKAKKERIC